MKRVYSCLLIVLAGLILTTVITWPFALNINTMYSDQGDYPFNGWILWYNQKAITSGRIFDQQAYFNSDQLYPFSNSLSFSDNLIIPSLIFTPIFLISRDLITSTNIMIYLSFILTFISAFLTLKYLFKDNATSFLGAMIFTYNPITFSHFPIHLQLLDKYFLPPTFLFGYLFFSKPNFKNAFFLFLFFTLNALTSIYFFIFTVALLPIELIPFLIKGILDYDYSYFLNLAKSALTILIFLPLLWYFLIPYSKFSNLEGATRSISADVGFSASLSDWVSNDQNSFLYQKLTASHFDRSNQSIGKTLSFYEHSLSPNVIPSILFIFGIIYLFKNKQFARKNSLLIYSMLALLIISFVLTFGPYWLDFKVNGSSPQLPFYSLYNYLPILRGIRVPTRFQFIFYLPFCIFIGFGLTFLFSKSKRWKLVLSVVICLIIILENFQTFNYKTTAPLYEKYKSAYSKNLLSFLKNKNTIHFPIESLNTAMESRYLNWVTLTDEVTFNGYSGYYPDDRTSFIQKVQSLDNDALKRLKAANIDYVILHKDLLGSDYPKFTKNKDLDKLTVFEDNDIRIIDVDKFDFKYNTCTDRDIQVRPKSTVFPIRNIDGLDHQLIISTLVLKNTKDCYQLDKYQDRYQTLTVYVKNQKITLHYKLPILIEPYQEINVKTN